MWSPWSQQSCRKRPRAFIFATQRLHHILDVTSPLCSSQFPVLVWDCDLEPVSGSFALQFSLMTVVSCILLSVTPTAGNFFLASYDNLTLKEIWNYPLPKVFRFWAKFSEPSNPREGSWGTESLHPVLYFCTPSIFTVFFYVVGTSLWRGHF